MSDFSGGHLITATSTATAITYSNLGQNQRRQYLTVNVKRRTCIGLRGEKQCPDFGDNPNFTECCPSKIEQGSFYCCSADEMNETDQERTERRRIILQIAGATVCALVAIATSLLLCCFLCKSCFFYRYNNATLQVSLPSEHVHAHNHCRSSTAVVQNGATVAGNRSSSTFYENVIHSTNRLIPDGGGGTFIDPKNDAAQKLYMLKLWDEQVFFVSAPPPYSHVFVHERSNAEPPLPRLIAQEPDYQMDISQARNEIVAENAVSSSNSEREQSRIIDLLEQDEILIER
uniref:Uncharacterized protein n=1 Tax=Romanomermis culicivorax TaxID=13658 RepID=A0A915IPF2_ROMCU